MAIVFRKMENLKKYLNNQDDSDIILKKKRSILASKLLDTPLHSWPKDKERLTEIIKNYVENLSLDTSNTFSDEIVSDLTVLDENDYLVTPEKIKYINNCSRKSLLSIVKILYRRAKSIKKILELKKQGVEGDILEDEIKKVITYNIVLDKYLPILNIQESLDVFNIDSANELFDQVCTEGYEEIPTKGEVEDGIKKNKEEQDFDIVSALSYVGVDVDKDDFGYYSVIKNNNGKGIKYYIGRQEKSFALSKSSCKKFVDEFLNKPSDERKYITPGQVFITYISEAEKSLGLKTRTAVELNDLFGSLKGIMTAKAYFKEVIKRFSRNAPEWKDYQKIFYEEYYSNRDNIDETTKKMVIKQQAKKLVIADVFENCLNGNNILTDEQIYNSDYRASDISKDFGFDVDITGLYVDVKNIAKLEDFSLRTVNSLHSTLQDLKSFTQEIIDNYTIDYLRKEKVFLLAQDDQNEFIDRKKEYEDVIEKLSYDKSKDSQEKIKYFKQQIEELMQKIGNQEYRQAKETLQLAKNNFRILLLNSKIQKEIVETALNEALEKCNAEGKIFEDKDKIEVIKNVLDDMPEVVLKFEKGKATSWVKYKIGEKAVKQEQALFEVDKVIERTASKISDESHQKIMEENKIRENISKTQKEERLKSANAYFNAYENTIKKASNIGGFGNLSVNASGNKIDAEDIRKLRNSSYINGKTPINFENPEQSLNAYNNDGFIPNVNINAYGGNGFIPNYPMPPIQPQNDYDYDHIAESIEPCVIPYIVGYEKNGVSVYGSKLENYATFDRYKFLLETKNNALYYYVEKEIEKTPEKIISDLHIRYLKNAFAKSGFSATDDELSKFNYKMDVKPFVTPLVAQNLVDVVVSDYNDLCASVDFDMLKDLIEHKKSGDLAGYMPENIKNDIQASANIIASVVKAIMTDESVKKTYDAYSSKMKQTYISSLLDKIDNGEIPTIKLNADDVYSRMIDYISFSIKGQNVIIQNEDAKDSGLSTYPRSIYFKQKENADIALNTGKILTFEQNEIITTRNDPSLGENRVTNLFGTLYKFNGSYNKLLLRLKSYNLCGGVRFIENLIDALKLKMDIKQTISTDTDSEANSFAKMVALSNNEEALQEELDKSTDYEDDEWYLLRDFVVGKSKVIEFAMYITFGLKYGLDIDKKKLKADFYENDLLSLPKINKEFNGLSEDIINQITSIIRNLMGFRTERMVDYIDELKKQYNLYLNKMLYIREKINDFGDFDSKTAQEKLSAIVAIDADFNHKADDLKTPHPEIYSSIDEVNQYFNLFMYYALGELTSNYKEDKNIVTPKLEEYIEDLKKTLRNDLLNKIKNNKYLNGYEEIIAKYFELKLDSAVTKSVKNKTEEKKEVVKAKELVKLQSIDVVFKGIYDGFFNAVINESSEIKEKMQDVDAILELAGTLPTSNIEEQDLEITLPDNLTLRCNAKGFIQQYILKSVFNAEEVDENFENILNTLALNGEYGEVFGKLKEVVEIISSDELGINLFEKFSTISLSNYGNVFKFGDNISTVIFTINRLKDPSEIDDVLQKDVFYKESVEVVQNCFEKYFKTMNL